MTEWAAGSGASEGRRQEVEPAGASPRARTARAEGGDELAETVKSLEAELLARRRRRVLRWALGLSAGAALAVGAISYKRATAPPPPPRFTLAPLEVRDIAQKVQSTGVVEPLHRVEVGAQVSGRVVAVAVDFNDPVARGQLLAEIDPELFGAEVVQSRAQLDSSQATILRAKAARDAARVRLARLQLLVTEGAASDAELDQAQADFDIAEAEVGAAQAQAAQVSAHLNSARATLKYTKIHSPIDGVVIDRRVEPGQTVAASFNTPVLFEIARDLTQMRVLSDIDEADVGKVREGMTADIVVDAFPDEHFAGKLMQIRLSPKNVEGVVTYSAVIDVANPEGKLRPGMTATATVTTAHVERALAVRNAALRFEPIKAEDASSERPPAEDAEPPLGRGRGRVYRVRSSPDGEDTAEPLELELGISDGVWTQVVAGLSADALVVVDERNPEARRGFRLF